MTEGMELREFIRMVGPNSFNILMAKELSQSNLNKWFKESNLPVFNCKENSCRIGNLFRINDYGSCEMECSIRNSLPNIFSSMKSIKNYSDLEKILEDLLDVLVKISDKYGFQWRRFELYLNEINLIRASLYLYKQLSQFTNVAFSFKEMSIVLLDCNSKHLQISTSKVGNFFSTDSKEVYYLSIFRELTELGDMIEYINSLNLRDLLQSEILSNIYSTSEWKMTNMLPLTTLDYFRTRLGIEWESVIEASFSDKKIIVKTLLESFPVSTSISFENSLVHTEVIKSQDIYIYVNQRDRTLYYAKTFDNIIQKIRDIAENEYNKIFSYD